MSTREPSFDTDTTRTCSTCKHMKIELLFGLGADVEVKTCTKLDGQHCALLRDPSWRVANPCGQNGLLWEQKS